jgi:hypothetical protein
MELVLDSQGELVTPDLYEVKTSESLTGLLLDYIYKRRLNKLFDNCMTNAYDGDAVLCPHSDQQWEVQRCAVPVLSDMFLVQLMKLVISTWFLTSAPEILVRTLLPH